MTRTKDWQEILKRKEVKQQTFDISWIKGLTGKRPVETSNDT